MKVKVISLPYIFLVVYVLCFTRIYKISGERLQDHWSSGLCMLQLIVITQQLLHLMIRWCQIGVEPSDSSTKSSTNNHLADNPEITSEE